MKVKVKLALIIALTLFVGLLGWWFQSCGSDEGFDESESVAYVILDDDYGTLVQIGVTPCVTEKQLRATLKKAADERTQVGARDYMLANHLTVEVFLVGSDARDEGEFAGSIRRFVPLRAEDDVGMILWLENKIVSVISGQDKYVIVLRRAKDNVDFRQGGTGC